MDSYLNIHKAAHDGAFGHNALAHPTPAMQDAGNYKKGRAVVRGFPVVIENPRGTLREWRAADGTSGANLMRFDYGYFQGVKGADGDELDVYLGPAPESNTAYVVNQFLRGSFDEHKVMLGFPDRRTAEAGYLSNFDSGWQGLNSCVPCSLTQLKWWMTYGDMSKPLTPDQLPYEERNDMQKVIWDSANAPVGVTLAQLLYRIREHDGRDSLMFDPLTAAEILADSDGVLTLDALVVPYAKLEPRMAILKKVMDRAVDGLSVASFQITEPFSQKGTTNVAAVFELSDGQTLSVFFHNPDVTPKKIMPGDDLVSWKWMLNKKDVTIAVAPERGRDLNVRNVALRVMSLAGKNSSRFASTNAKRAERMANIDGLQKEFSEKEATLEALTTEINELEAIVANKPAKPAEPIAAPNPETAPELGAPSPEALDPTKHVEFGEAPWLLPKSIIESWPESTYQEALNLTEAQNLSAENLVLRAARTGSLDEWKEAQSNMFAAQGAGGPTPQPEPAIEPQAPAADGKPDLTYRKVDDMFTVFYPETPAGEKAWANIAAHTDGTGKVLHAQVDGTIEQLREAGYTVAPAAEPAQGIDDILAELDEPAAPAANKVYTEQESAELEARAAALRPQIEALSDTELAMMAATAPLSIGGFDALVTGKDASGDKRARLIDKIMANHPDDIEASLTRWRENYAPAAPEAPAAPDPEQVKAAREQAIKDALLALGWEDLGYGSIARTIRGGFKGGMVNPEGLRRLFPRFNEPVLQAVLGEDKVLASVMMGDNESPEAIAKKFDDAVTAIDKDAAPDMTKEEKVARANELGAAAFAAGKKRVPASDAAIAPLLGGGTANDVLTAWLAGWDSANLAAPAFDAQEIADQWRIMPDARRIGVLTAAGIPETSIAILKNKPFEDMPRERQSAIAAALLAETPAAPAAPTVPDGVRRAVEGALETLRGIKSGIDDAAALEQKIGGNGRYQADALRNRQADIERAQGTLAEFRQHAPDNGVDAEAFIASLGGEPDLTPSGAAAEWLKPKEPAAPAPAPEPQAPAANPDIDYMQSIIGGSADLADPAIPARLKQIHADNADNADVQALFKEAVKAYSAYAIAKAKAKLA